MDNRKKVLFINCCIRENSRTEKMARIILKEYTNSKFYDFKETVLSEKDIKPLSEKDTILRDIDIKNQNFDSNKYELAKDFAAADKIFISAPFWDNSFPSLLKVYIEHICVVSLTLGYDQKGYPKKFCKADSLCYITTSGGFLPENPSVKIYFKELCDTFCIKNYKFIFAQALDIFPDKTDELIEKSLKQQL